MRKVIVVALGLFLSSAAGAATGYHYKAKTETTGTNLKQPDRALVEVWVEGPNGKLVFEEAGAQNPMVSEGKYLLTNNGGETVYLVDPKENTHAKFDLDQLLTFAGEFMESGMMDVEVANYQVDELDRGDGPDMHGYDTEYRKYRTTYDLSVKVLGMKRADSYVLDHEVWSVDNLEAAGFQAWMRPRKTGFEAVDTLLEGELNKVRGFPFRSVTTTRAEGVKKKKRASSTTVTTEVTLFEKSNVPNSMFVLSPDSQEISLFGATGASPDDQQPPDEEEEGGFMKRLKKLRKGDG